MNKLHCKQTFLLQNQGFVGRWKNKINIAIKQTLILITTLVSFNAEAEISRRFENRQKNKRRQDFKRAEDSTKRPKEELGKRIWIDAIRTENISIQVVLLQSTYMYLNVLMKKRGEHMSRRRKRYIANCYRDYINYRQALEMEKKWNSNLRKWSC